MSFGFVALVIQMCVFFLQVELNPVVKTDKFCSRFCFSNKDMFKSTGVWADHILPEKNITAIHTMFFFFFVENSTVKKYNSCSSVSPYVPLSVVQVEPDQTQLILEGPQVWAGLSFTHQIPVSSLWTNHIYCIGFLKRSWAGPSKNKNNQNKRKINKFRIFKYLRH